MNQKEQARKEATARQCDNRTKNLLRTVRKVDRKTEPTKKGRS